MKAAVALGYQQPFIIKGVDVSLPGRDEILVKIVATGVCRTDAVIYDNPKVVSVPTILGHEGVGIIASVGEAVSGTRVGDHVALSYAACHCCESCLSDHPSACEEFNTLNSGGRHKDGTAPCRLGDQDLSLFFGQSSFSQYVVTRASNAAVVDPEVGLVLLDPLGCDTQTGSGTVLNHLKPVIGESIMMFGCGAIGLSAIVAAKLTGCSQIVAVGIHTSHLALADKLGATHQINDKKQGAMALIKQTIGKDTHYAVGTTGVSTTVLQVVHAVKPLSMVAIVGFVGDITFNMQNDLMAEGESLVGVTEGDAIPALFTPLLVQQYKQGKFPIGKLVVHHPLADINQAFVDSVSGRVIKPMVTM